MTPTAQNWINLLQDFASPQKAEILSRFFKTGKGEYGEGDIFVGITVPQNREVAKKFFDTDFLTIEQMLNSPIHEYRLSALLALVQKYKKQKHLRSQIVDFYLSHTSSMNNWDLVDLSAPYTLGDHWIENIDNNTIKKLSDSPSIWDRRISIVATLMLIRNKIFQPTLTLSQKFLSDSHPLIHKATGWMLREIGKRDLQTLTDFLDRFAVSMPRTALRYAIERLDKEKRDYYMKLPR